MTALFLAFQYIFFSGRRSGVLANILGIQHNPWSIFALLTLSVAYLLYFHQILLYVQNMDMLWECHTCKNHLLWKSQKKVWEEIFIYIILMSRVVEVNRYAVNRGSKPMHRDGWLTEVWVNDIKAKDYDLLEPLLFYPHFLLMHKFYCPGISISSSDQAKKNSILRNATFLIWFPLKPPDN